MNSEIISKDEQLSQIKCKVDFKNLKSDYFLIKLFDIMKKNKLLKIMKYNKKLQNRFNLSINDYKEYSQLYSSIEIELKFDDNEHDKYYKIINIPEKEKEYFHIYFENSNEEIKRNYLKEEEKGNKIIIIIDYQVRSFKDLFKDCYFIYSIFFKKFHRNNINDMSDIVNSCVALKD